MFKLGLDEKFCKNNIDYGCGATNVIEKLQRITLFEKRCWMVLRSNVKILFLQLKNNECWNMVFKTKFFPGSTLYSLT